MNRWGEDLYGDPCRECGWAWSTSGSDAIALVDGVAAAYRALLARATGDERHPALAWSVTAYVCHVGDNLRIWAERLASASDAEDRPVTVAAYDADALAEARRYDGATLSGALWSLARAAADWCDAVAVVPGRGTLMLHSERGPLDRDDVARANAHDAVHHRWDIERSLRASSHDSDEH